MTLCHWSLVNKVVSNKAGGLQHWTGFKDFSFMPEVSNNSRQGWSVVHGHAILWVKSALCLGSSGRSQWAVVQEGFPSPRPKSCTTTTWYLVGHCSVSITDRIPRFNDTFWSRLFWWTRLNFPFDFYLSFFSSPVANYPSSLPFFAAAISIIIILLFQLPCW